MTYSIIQSGLLYQVIGLTVNSEVCLIAVCPNETTAELVQKSLELCEQLIETKAHIAEVEKE